MHNERELFFARHRGYSEGRTLETQAIEPQAFSS